MKEKLEFLKDDYAWIATILTICGAIGMASLRFLNYIWSKSYFDYFGLDYELYKPTNNNFMYELFIAISFILYIYIICYCYKQNLDIIKKKKGVSKFLFNTTIIIVSNGYFVTFFKLKSLLYNAVSFFVIIFCEIILALMMSFIYKRENKKNIAQDNNKIDKIDFFFDNLKGIFVCLIYIFFSIHFLQQKTLSLRLDYRLTEDNKVVAYTTDNYYLLLDSHIMQDGTLEIYKGSQKKINNTDIETETINFENVLLIEDFVPYKSLTNSINGAVTQKNIE